MKRLKFDGGEFSGARPDWMKEYGDMFPSEFHQLMEAETVNLYIYFFIIFLYEFSILSKYYINCFLNFFSASAPAVVATGK